MISKPINRNGTKCPLYRTRVDKVCHECELYQHVSGKHPQTGDAMDYWGCAFNVAIFLSIENTAVAQRSVATMDALRREVQQASDVALVDTLGRLNDRIDDARANGATKLIGN